MLPPHPCDATRPDPVGDFVVARDPAIAHLLDEVEQRETAIRDTLSRWSVTPHAITYEEIVASYEETLRAALVFLDAPGDVRVPYPAFAQLADETSDRWYARFLAERGP